MDKRFCDVCGEENEEEKENKIFSAYVGEKYLSVKVSCADDGHVCGKCAGKAIRYCL